MKRYAEAAALHGRASIQGDYKTANVQYDILTEIYWELKERGKEAQLSFVELLSHDDPHVRGWVAAHALEFAPERAEAALVELAKAKANFPMASFTAEMTLKEWRKGTLEFPRRAR